MSEEKMTDNLIRDGRKDLENHIQGFRVNLAQIRAGKS